MVVRGHVGYVAAKFGRILAVLFTEEGSGSIAIAGGEQSAAPHTAAAPISRQIPALSTLYIPVSKSYIF